MGSQANFLQSLGWAVWNSLWQMALLWVVYQLLTGLLIKTKPAAKSGLATTLLLLGFVWFVYTFFAVFSGRTVTDDTLASGFLSPDPASGLNNWLQRSLPVASIVYLTLLLLPVFRFIRNYRYVQIIRRYGLSKLQVDWRMFVNKTATRMGIQKPVHAWISEWVTSPVTIGFWKPVILVPLAAINHLTPQQVEAVLLHELAHIRRSDYLVNLVINFIQTILYFNPFVKAFVKIVEREREKSCDEMVLQFQYDSHDYATALLTLEKTSHLQRPFVLAAAGNKNDLLHRVESILGIHKKPVFTFNKLAGVIAGALCIITLNALLLINKPVADKGVSLFTEVGSPVAFFGDAEREQPDPTAEVEMKAALADAAEKTAAENEVALSTNGMAEEEMPIEINPEIINAGFEIAQQIPLLNKRQEQEVKEAIAASKKVLEDVQWKMVEKNIAEVFSRREKESLKYTYEKALNNVDWKNWENKLRQAYDKVDWERVNEQLSNAVSMVRIDSLQRVYADAICKLDQAKSEMAENNLSGIPDSDVTLQQIEQKRKDLIKLNNFLKAVRSKKIVHL